MPDSQQAADFEVLSGLRHHGLVCGHDQQDDVDPAHTGQHVLDEALVAGHVHEANAQILAQVQVGEAEINGDAAPLFLFPPVRVCPGQDSDQRCLAVVDVPAGSDDDVLPDASH